MFENLFYLTTALGIIVPIVTFFKLSKTNFQTFRIVPFLLLLLISSVYEYVCTYLFKINSSVWFRIYGLLEFCTLYYYYTNLVRSHRFVFKSFLIFYILAFTFFTINWKLKSRLLVDSYLITLELLFVFIATIFWYKQLFREARVTSLFTVSDFYFVSGFILYFSGTFVLDLMSDTIFKNNKSEILVYWNLMLVSNIVLRLLIFVGIWKKSEK